MKFMYRLCTRLLTHPFPHTRAQVQTALAIHVAFILPAVAIGLACGLCGILFTIVNVKVMRLRNEIIGVRCTISMLYV